MANLSAHINSYFPNNPPIFINLCVNTTNPIPVKALHIFLFPFKISHHSQFPPVTPVAQKSPNNIGFRDFIGIQKI